MSLKQIDKRKLIIALSLLLLVIAAAVGFSLTRMDEPARKAAAEAAEEKKEAVEDACASRTTFQGLKQLIFDQAGRIRTGERVNFDILAASAFARMENPVVASRDESLALTRCSGRFILELPPGAEVAFGGERRLAAGVEYEVQAAADGSGPVYRMTGAEGIVRLLAAFDMEGRRLPQDTAPAGDPFANMAEPPPLGPEPAEPTEAPPAPEPVASNPSFDCRDARTRGEVMVCSSNRLAAQDRAMSALFDAAIADADRRARRRLLETRDRFVAYRDRCGGETCVADAYQGRMAEIRDIMADSR